MKYIVKYPEPAANTFPDFIYQSVDGVANVFRCNGHCLGISVDDPVGEFDIIADKGQLFAYLVSVQPNFNGAPTFDEFSQTNMWSSPGPAADMLWNRLTYLNSL